MSNIVKVVEVDGNFATLMKRWEDIVNGVGGEGCFATKLNSKIALKYFYEILVLNFAVEFKIEL